MALIRIAALPGDAMVASAEFHTKWLPVLRADLASSSLPCIVLFQPADHTHRGWRLAAIQGLAHEYAPLRVNAIESADEAAIAATEAYLASAPGLTGQLLRLDGAGEGKVV